MMNKTCPYCNDRLYNCDYCDNTGMMDLSETARGLIIAFKHLQGITNLDVYNNRKLRQHDLKTDPKVFEWSMIGVKDYEIRFNDRDFRVGDILNLLETTESGVDIKSGKPLVYTGRVLKREVTSVLSDYGLQNGWVILNVKPYSV